MAKANAKAPALPVLKDEYDERAKYDWQAIRHDFIYGVDDGTGTVVYPKPKELETIHNTPAAYISNRATKEKWLKYREANQNEEAIARQKEHQKRLANKAVKFDEQVINDSETTQRILGDRLRQIEMLQSVDRDRIQDLIMDVAEGKRQVNKALRDELKPLASAYEIESIMKSVALNLEVAHKAMGIEEGKQNVINTTVQIANVTPSQALQEADELRQEALKKFFENKNVRIPSLGIGGPEPEAIESGTIEGDIIDGEVIDRETINGSNDYSGN